MAALNLTPDFVIIAGQAVLFSVNLCVVSKLWVQPYLELRKKHTLFTADVQTRAEALLASSQSKLRVIEDRLQEERNTLHHWMEQERQKALHVEKEQLEKSRRESVAQVERFRLELRSHLQEEADKIPLYVSELSQRCMTAVLQG